MAGNFEFSSVQPEPEVSETTKRPLDSPHQGESELYHNEQNHHQHSSHEEQHQKLDGDQTVLQNQHLQQQTLHSLQSSEQPNQKLPSLHHQQQIRQMQYHQLQQDYSLESNQFNTQPTLHQSLLHQNQVPFKLQERQQQQQQHESEIKHLQQDQHDSQNEISQQHQEGIAMQQHQQQDSQRQSFQEQHVSHTQNLQPSQLSNHPSQQLPLLLHQQQQKLLQQQMQIRQQQELIQQQQHDQAMQQSWQQQQQAPTVVFQVAPQGTLAQSYRYRQAYILSLVQIAIGTLCIIFQLSAFGVHAHLAFIMPGVWSGILFMVTGVLGYRSAMTRAQCWVVAFMVLCITDAVLCFPILLIAGYGLDWDHSHQARDQIVRCEPNHTNCTSQYFHLHDKHDAKMALNSIMILLALCELVVAVWAAALCCSGVCCRVPPIAGEVVYYNNSAIQAFPPTQQVVVVNPSQSGVVYTGPVSMAHSTANSAGVPAGYSNPLAHRILAQEGRVQESEGESSNIPTVNTMQASVQLSGGSFNYSQLEEEPRQSMA